MHSVDSDESQQGCGDSAGHRANPQSFPSDHRFVYFSGVGVQNLHRILEYHESDRDDELDDCKSDKESPSVGLSDEGYEAAEDESDS